MAVVAVEVNPIAGRAVRLEHMRRVELAFLPFDEHVLADAIRPLAPGESQSDQEQDAPLERAHAGASHAGA